MNESYRNAIATHGASIITHIGLVNGLGTEISGGGYARQAVTWTSASGGQIRPSTNLLFNIAAGTTVAGWQGFTASSGGTNHGGAALSSVTFSNPGTYTLQSANTAINHNAG